jgi:hypothetical protein
MEGEKTNLCAGELYAWQLFSGKESSEKSLALSQTRYEFGVKEKNPYPLPHIEHFRPGSIQSLHRLSYPKHRKKQADI